MRGSLIAALLVIAPCAVAAAQDSTQTDHKQNQDSVSQQQQSQQQQPTDSRWAAPQGDEAILMRMHRTNQMEIRVGKLAQRNSRSAKVKAFGAKLARDHAASDQKVITLGNKLGFTLTRGEQMDSTGKFGQRGGRYGREGMGQRNDSTRWGQRNDSTRWNQRNDSTQRTQRNDSTPVDSAYRQGYNQTPDSSQGQGMDSTQHNAMRQHMQDMQRLGTLRGAAFDTAFANLMVEGHEKAISMLEQSQSQVQNDELRTLITATLPTLRVHLQTAQSLGGKSATTTSSLQ